MEQTDMPPVVIMDGTDPVLAIDNFNRIRDFILSKGLRRAYCTKYIDNPCCDFPGFTTYLDPEYPLRSGEPEYNAITICQPKTETDLAWHIQLDYPGKRLILQQWLGGSGDESALIKECRRCVQSALEEISRR